MEAAVARAQYDLDRTVLVAPVSGRIAPLLVQAGDYLNSGHPIIAIVSDQNWRLVVNLPERILHGLKVGQPVWCYIGSDPWKIHRGEVRSIAPGVARSVNAAGILPYVDLNTDWIRLARRFPVEIDLGDLPQRDHDDIDPNTLGMVKSPLSHPNCGILVRCSGSRYRNN
jgi:membrane fusion protein, multidrug efflux system